LYSSRQIRKLTRSKKEATKVLGAPLATGALLEGVLHASSFCWKQTGIVNFQIQRLCCTVCAAFTLYILILGTVDPPVFLNLQEKPSGRNF
jgi:hypothetical protein